MNEIVSPELPVHTPELNEVVSPELPVVPVVADRTPELNEVVSPELPVVPDRTPKLNEVVSPELPVVPDRTPELNEVVSPELPVVPERTPVLNEVVSPELPVVPERTPELNEVVSPELPVVSLPTTNTASSPIEESPLSPQPLNEAKVTNGKCKSTYGPLYEKLIMNREKYNEMLKVNIEGLAKELDYDTNDKSLAVTEGVRSKINAILSSCHPDKNLEDLDNTNYIANILIQIKQLNPPIFASAQPPEVPVREVPVEEIPPSNISLSENPYLKDETAIQPSSTIPHYTTQAVPMVEPPRAPTALDNLRNLHSPDVPSVSHPGMTREFGKEGGVAYRRGTYRKKLLKKRRFGKTLKK